MNLTLTFADMFKRASLISCARLSRQSSLVPCRRPFKSTRVDTCESLWDIVSLKLIHCILTYRYMMIHVVNSISVSSWIFWIMSIGFYRSLAISCSTNIDPRPHQIHVFLKSLKCIPDWFKRGPVSERRDSYLCVDRTVRFRCPSCQVLKDVERVGRSLPQTWNVRYFEILGHAADPTGAKPFLRGRAVSYETDPTSNVWSDLTRSFIWMKWIQILMKVLEQYRRWFSRWRLQILLCKCKVWRHHSRSWFVPEMNSFFDIVTKCIKMLQRLENGWNEYRNTEIQSRVCKGCDKPKQFSDFRFFSD